MTFSAKALHNAKQHKTLLPKAKMCLEGHKPIRAGTKVLMKQTIYKNKTNDLP